MGPDAADCGAALGDAAWMRRALDLAQLAECAGEVPVGAVLVRGGVEIAAGHNAVISDSDPTAHAEIVALRRAAAASRNYRLPGTTLYVTLEPCAMCAGAIVQARVARVVFGARDAKAGAAGSVFGVLDCTVLNHRPSVTGGVLADAASKRLQMFFKERRKSV